MTTTNGGRLSDAGRRAVLLGAVGAVASGGLSAALATSAVDQWQGWGVQEVAAGLGLLATVASALASGWVALVLTAATSSLLRGGRVVGHAAAQGGHPLVRRVAAGLLVIGSVGLTPALAVAAGPAHVVTSTTTASTPLPPGSTPQEQDPPGLPLPQPGWTPTVTRQPPQPSTDVALVSTTPSEATGHVVVHRGDTLWGLVARHLGDRATDQDVAEEWPRWYAANRDVIGADPDLILPGQQLVVPPAGEHR